MHLRSFLLSALLLLVVFVAQYILVTNGVVTGIYYTSDTGRLSPWPTLLPFAPRSAVFLVLRPFITVFVFPASLFCRVAFGHSALHPTGLLTSYFREAMRSPQQEHLFLLQLSLLNTVSWLLVWALVRPAWRRFMARPEAA